MSSTTVVRYITTTPNFSLGIGSQTTDQTRPGFSNQFRKPWTAQSGYNSVTLNQVYSPTNQTSPESGSSYIGFNDSANPVLISYLGISSTRCKAVLSGSLVSGLSTSTNTAGTVDNRYNSEQYYSTQELFTFYVSNTSSSYRINGTSYSGYPYGLPISFTWQSRTLTKSGSSVTLSTPNQDQLTTGNITSRALIQVSFSANTQETFYHTASFSGTLTRSWEGVDHKIDGTGGDTPPSIQSNFSLTASSNVIRYSNNNIQADFSFEEQGSKSVITGVEAILNNNFSLSASSKINLFTTITLNQQVDCLATTFNFRYADPLSLQSDYSLSSAGGIIRNLSSELILSTDTTFTQTAGLIYDISVDYSWDDFAIDGKFKDNLLDGGIQYTWDGVDYYNWGTWPNDNWEQTDISWDEWPSDTWNGSERIVTEFNTQNTGNAIRGALINLLSESALSENAAFLKEGASSLRSDFLCDGSPSGLMGGSSTMISDFIVDSFANYIINNTQNINGAFDATLLANYIVQFLWSVRSDFSLDVTSTFKPGGVTNAQCISVVDALGNAIYGSTNTLEGAFDPEFTARLFFTTDPYQIYKVLQETRQIFVEAESRGIEIPQEIRLNSIPAENRDWLVPQETRNIKLRIPPMVDRTTTPKVRRE